MSAGRVWVAYGILCSCLLPCVFIGKECLVMCGVSDDRCLGVSFVAWLFGGRMHMGKNPTLLVVLLVP